MVKSMTGYGRGYAESDLLTVSVEIKAVNHRFFESNIKSPRMFSFIEDKIKSCLQKRISRGKLDVFISYTSDIVDSTKVTINEAYSNGYIEALKSLQQKYKLKNDISVSTVARNPEVFTVSKADIDEKVITEVTLKAVENAVDAFVEARLNEGEKLYNDILGRLDFIKTTVAKIEELSPITEKAYRDRLTKKLNDLLEGQNIDEQRIITETAIFADKIAVNEETVRLNGHIEAFKELLLSDQPVGKKLDFYVQEMNREANTTGSKCQDNAITKLVVEIKSEIEKIREQIQNIE